jgi:CrcB protein
MHWLVQIALVAGGGALGALGRTAGSASVTALVGSGWSVGRVLGTFAVNILGCFLMGVACAAADRGGWGDERMQAFVFSGFLGAFTTFSTFESDTMLLWRNGREVAAGAYMGGSVAVGLIAFLVGWTLASNFTS